VACTPPMTTIGLVRVGEAPVAELPVGGGVATGPKPVQYIWITLPAVAGLEVPDRLPDESTITG